MFWRGNEMFLLEIENKKDKDRQHNRAFVSDR